LDTVKGSASREINVVGTLGRKEKQEQQNQTKRERRGRASEKGGRRWDGRLIVLLKEDRQRRYTERREKGNVRENSQRIIEKKEWGDLWRGRKRGHRGEKSLKKAIGRGTICWSKEVEWRRGQGK